MKDVSETIQAILDEVSAAQMRLDSALNQTLNLAVLDPEDLRSVNNNLQRVAMLTKTLVGE